MANYYSSTLQKGSNGDEVKKWQEYLNTQGYGLTVDGIFGDKTDAATRDYQTKNGLTVDGIVGANTWGKAGYTNVNTPTPTPSLTSLSTPTPTPTATSSYTYTPFEYDDFTASAETQGAKDSLTNAETALGNHGDFNWVDQGKLDDYTSQYENRDPFSYDFNTDALYQQYKDKYIKQAKMASADVMGQASAMTGGYGSSYAQTVGNQAYQSNLEQLNDVIPELYQLAYDKYNQEGQDLLNTISMLRGERDFAYGQHNDEYNKLVNDRNYWSDTYNNLYNRDYSQYANDRAFAQSEHNTSEGYKYQTDRDAVSDAQWQATFDEGKRQYEESMNVSKQQWQAEFDESKRQFESNASFARQQYEDSKEVALSGSSGSSGGSGSSSGGSGGSSGSSGIPSSIDKKASAFTSNDKLASYLDGQVASGAITESQADYLYAQYVDENEMTTDSEGNKVSASYSDMVKSTNGWTVVDDGGANLWGIDQDAIVTAPNGEQLTLKQLKSKLVDDEDMSSSDAASYIKKLQQNLGISTNWLFGW
jgi:peptidoglycan hydrolase-like protein with peptidoglycan-binding domain